MASNKLFHAKRDNTFILVTPDADFNHVNAPESLFDFDEADVWNDHSNHSSSVSQFESKKIVPSSRPSRKGGRNTVVERTSRPITCAASLPVNIPDWSKIYREDNYPRHHKKDDDQDSVYDGKNHGVEDEDEDERVPPHEYLARRRGASFSVHEGIGRTLKGRDLRQVRNAVWKKVGFED